MPFRYFHSGTQFCSVLRVSSVVLTTTTTPTATKSKSKSMSMKMPCYRRIGINTASKRARAISGIKWCDVIVWISWVWSTKMMCTVCASRKKILIVRFSCYCFYGFCVLCLECAFYFIVLFFYLFFFSLLRSHFSLSWRCIFSRCCLFLSIQKPFIRWIVPFVLAVNVCWRCCCCCCCLFGFV